MAKINPVKLKQEADKAEKAGRLDQAIALYRQVVDDNPRDWNSINKIGDLYAKLNKLREAAAEYAKVADYWSRDGFHLKAIAIWKKINKLDPTALEPYLNLADLYAKQGLMMEAKAQYQVVIEEYAKRGRGREAADVLRKMAEIEPGDLKVRSKLADLYTREGRVDKAVEEHVAIAAELSRKGHLAEALQVLEKGLKLDSHSRLLREEIARVHLLRKEYPQAAAAIQPALRAAPGDATLLALMGEAQLGAGRLDEAEQVLRQRLAVAPDDVEARVVLGKVCLAQRQPERAYEELLPAVDKLMERRESERAVALLQLLVDGAPGHVRTLLKLVELHRMTRNDRAVALTYGLIADAYLTAGQLEQAASVLEILVSSEPQNPQHRKKLQSLRARLPRAGAAPARDEEFEEGLDFALSEADLDLEHEAPPARAGAIERPTIELSGPLSDEDREFVEEHLAEGRVFRKYGLVDKAADQFEAIVARFQDNAEARVELVDVYKEKGHNARAAAHLLGLAEISRLQGDGEAAAAHEAEARRLAPESAATAEPRPQAAPAAPPSAPEPALTFQEEEFSLGGEEEVALGASEEVEIPLEEEEEPVAAATVEEALPLEVEEAGLEGLELGEPEPEEAPAPSFAPGLDLSLDEEEGLPLATDSGAGDELSALDLGPAPETGQEAELGLGELDLPDLGPPPSASPVTTPLVDLPPIEELRAPQVPEASTAPVAAMPAELQRVLEEVDSYVALGFVDDAREALREAHQRFPDHPALEEKLREVGLAAPPAEVAEAALPVGEALLPAEIGLPEPPSPPRRAAEPVAAVVAPPPEAAGSIDLGAELDALFETQSAVRAPEPEAGGTDLGDAGLAEIFREFKEGVDRQLGQEDHETRYNLGIAYKEMGLVDEAIAEFQLAARDAGRLLECASMLGICFLEKGMPKLAVKWFEKGLAAPDRRPEEYQGLRYDLAMAYEADGDHGRALQLFSELYGQDASFRDVAAKVRELRAELR